MAIVVIIGVTCIAEEVAVVVVLMGVARGEAVVNQIGDAVIVDITSRAIPAAIGSGPRTRGKAAQDRQFVAVSEVPDGAVPTDVGAWAAELIAGRGRTF